MPELIRRLHLTDLKAVKRYADIAGLRLDTGYSKETEGPIWTTRLRSYPGRSEVRHPPGL